VRVIYEHTHFSCNNGVLVFTYIIQFVLINEYGGFNYVGTNQ